MLYCYLFFVWMLIYSSYAYHRRCRQSIAFVAPNEHGKRNVDERRTVYVRKSGGVPMTFFQSLMMKRQSSFCYAHF